MMKSEFLEELSASNDQMIVKGKRSKRPRPSSSTSSNGADFCNPLSVSSPTTSSGISTTTEEDEDMANCLILLARGNSPADHKLGMFAYECKTCNRTFPSFQALGGHRASHKKPKTAAEVDHRKSAPQDEGKEQLSTIISPPLPSSTKSDPNKPKMHECSICGSEFGSGQALGGHMRRHRHALTTSAKIPMSIDDGTTSSNDKGRSMLTLDLNLPAPPDDEKTQQFPAEQQPPVVFSATALVGCHY